MGESMVCFPLSTARSGRAFAKLGWPAASYLTRGHWSFGMLKVCCLDDLYRFIRFGQLLYLSLLFGGFAGPVLGSAIDFFLWPLHQPVINLGWVGWFEMLKILNAHPRVESDHQNAICLSLCLYITIIPFYSLKYEFMLHHASDLFFNLACTFEGYFLDILLGSRKKKNGSAARVRSSSWLHWPAGDLFSVVVCTYFLLGQTNSSWCHFTWAMADDHQGFKLDPLKLSQDVRIANGSWCGADLVLVANESNVSRNL